MLRLGKLSHCFYIFLLMTSRIEQLKIFLLIPGKLYMMRDAQAFGYEVIATITLFDKP